MNQTYIQAFHIENSRIIVDEMTEELYNAIRDKGSKHLEQINEGAWIIEMMSPDRNIKYYIAISTDKNVVSKFMHGVMFADELLKKEDNNV